MKRGTITLIPFEDALLFAGIKAIIEIESHNAVVVEVLHLNPDGEWVVKCPAFEGSVPYKDLKRAVVIDKDNLKKAMYAIPIKDWKQVLTKIGHDIDFEIEPIPFVEGHYMKLCNYCQGYFTAAKRQPACESCCETFADAKIDFQKLPRTASKRARMITPAAAKEIARLAHQAGTKGEKFEDWYHKHY